MPIQAIMKNGKRMYRWGDSGKLYEKREDAEKQAAAAYASGYKKDGASKKKQAVTAKPAGKATVMVAQLMAKTVALK